MSAEKGHSVKWSEAQEDVAMVNAAAAAFMLASVSDGDQDDVVAALANNALSYGYRRLAEAMNRVCGTAGIPVPFTAEMMATFEDVIGGR